MADVPSQDKAQIVRVVQEAIKLSLGFQNQQKLLLLEDHIHKLFYSMAAKPLATIKTVANMFRISLSFEACLRWDDLKGTFLGNFIFTPEFIQVFLTGTKTDRYSDGQWCTFLRSTEPWSAHQLLLRLLHLLIQAWNNNPTASGDLILTSTPIMFHATGNTVTFPLAKSKKVSYFSFLCTLKEWCKRIGLATELFALHSLRH
eukprot:64622-Rhodomonas_salina.1